MRIEAIEVSRAQFPGHAGELQAANGVPALLEELGERYSTVTATRRFGRVL